MTILYSASYFSFSFLSWSIIRGYYCRKGQATGRKRSTKERFEEAAQVEGKANVILLIVHIVYSFVAAAIYLLGSPWMPWAQLSIPDWLRWLGVGLGITSFPFLI